MTNAALLRHSSFVIRHSMSPCSHVLRLGQSRLPLSRARRPNGRHGRGRVCQGARRAGAVRSGVGRARLRPVQALHAKARRPSSTRPSTASRRCSSPASRRSSNSSRTRPKWSNSCAAAAGLSLGEYTALVFAGVMDFEAGLRVVQERGRAMQDAADATSSGMVSILGLEREQVEALCDEARGGETLEIANLLCPGNIVVSGDTAACERIADAGHRGRRDEGDSAGRGRRVSHVAHAVGRRAAAKGAGRRADAEAANSGRFQRRRPAARRSRTKSASC